MYNSAAEEAACWRGGRGRPHVTVLTSCDRPDQQSDGAAASSSSSSEKKKEEKKKLRRNIHRAVRVGGLIIQLSDAPLV